MNLISSVVAQSLEIEGEANLSSSVQIAQLALKHRQNKNQRQRIVIFIGSPLSEDQVRPPDQLSAAQRRLLYHDVSIRQSGDKQAGFEHTKDASKPLVSSIQPLPVPCLRQISTCK